MLQKLQFNDIVLKYGLTHYFSCAYTPQQNSVVERKHQHLLNVARVLMFQSQIPLPYWFDCVVTAAFLINRLPSPFLHNKSPYELLLNKIPDYSVLRAFGCLCYVSTYTKDRHKFSPRACASVFLGYLPGYKGYKVLDLEIRSVSITRNVVFHEIIFPLRNDSSPVFDFFSHIILPASTPFVPDTTTANTHASPSSSPHSPASPPYPVVPLVPETVTSDTSLVSCPIKRPRRHAKAPSYLSDYHCALLRSHTSHIPSHHTTPYHLFSVLSYKRLSPPYFQFLMSFSVETEPKNFFQAMTSDRWKGAVNEELVAMDLNRTWSIVSLPPGKNAVGCKWVFTIKFRAGGTVERYKARLVAKGYTQQEGVDYNETFSPVIKLTSVKLMLDLAASKGWKLLQMDVSNAFLHSTLDEEIYMSLPQGYTPGPSEVLPPNPVCRLHKSLYGLKQASRQWNRTFSKVLITVGYVQSESDTSLFVKTTPTAFIAVLVYVDDIAIASNNDPELVALKLALATAFKIKDLGTMRFFLGLEIARSSSGISVCQRKYALDLLENAGLLACKPASVPMDPYVHLSSDDGVPLLSATPYRELIGHLLYLTITRPDITFVIHKLSQFLQKPTDVHLNAAHRVLKYLKGNPGQGLFYSSSSELCLNAFADADWASCRDTRISTTGYCVYLGTSLICWRSQKQKVASRSSTEAEYRALADVTHEILRFQKLLRDFHSDVTAVAKLFCDSKSAIYIATNPVFHERTKHVELDCHIVRNQLKAGTLNTIHVTSQNQLADILTKPLHPGPFRSLLGRMSISSLYLPRDAD